MNFNLSKNKRERPSVLGSGKVEKIWWRNRDSGSGKKLFNEIKFLILFFEILS
jgi:hypothetical protein